MSGVGGPPGEETAPLRPCPICGRPAVATYRPFCSRRCADVDLHRWLAGVYVMPTADDDGPAPDGEGDR